MPPPSTPILASPPHRKLLRIALIAICCCIPAVALIDIVGQSTKLVTRAGEPFDTVLPMLGGIIGALFGALLVEGASAENQTKAAYLLNILLFGLNFFLAAGHLGNRIAEYAAFGHSMKPIRHTPARIWSYYAGKGGANVDIGYDWIQFDIDAGDYDLLNANRRLFRSGAYCLDLRWQQAGRAVRVFLPTRSTLYPNRLTIIRCDARPIGPSLATSH